MVESYKDIAEKELFERYMPCISCPKCKSEEIVIDMENNGMFCVSSCKKCGFKI